MQPLRLCVFMALVAVLRCYELSQNLAEFYCTVNGDYDNREQLEKYGSNRTPIDLRVIPVLAPALSPLPVAYAEESSAGVVIRSVVILFQEGADNITYLTQHNFTGNTDIKPQTSDVSKIIKSLTLNDLQKNNCTGAIYRVKPFMFEVNYENCRQTAADGQRGSYVSTTTCNDVNLVVPVGAPEKPKLVPYRIKRHGKKYTMEDAPDNYVCNCDDTSS